MNQAITKTVYVAVLAGALCLLAIPSFSEELYNLEILFKRSYWDWQPDSVVYFGESICSAGDLNADGYDDIAAVGWEYEPVARWRALVFIFLGGDPMDTFPDVILEDDFWGGLGMSSIAGGDVNGDGFSDIVVGLPYGPGNVEVYFGGNPMDTVVDLHITEESPEEFFGCGVATGDINGDGYSDIVATDYFKGSGRGAAYVYYGGPLLDHIPDITLIGHGTEGFGTSVGSGGDVNSDGYEDIVVGAWANDEAYGDAGKIYVYYGGDPMDTTYDVGMCGEGSVNHLGWRPVDIVVDSSGYDCVVAATMFWPDGFPNTCSGKVYVLFGGDPMDSIPDVWMHGQTDSSGLGIVSSAGDVDGDGAEDVVAGAVTEASLGGAVYLWLGGADMDTVPDAWVVGDSTFKALGFCVSSAGDVDGDGRDELMLSNYPAGTGWHSVWVCKYTGTGIEQYARSDPDRGPVAVTSSPNPFKHHTVIQVRTAGSHDEIRDHKMLRIHDAAGRLVRSFDISKQVETFKWDGRDEVGHELPSGVYFLRLVPDQATAPVKLTLVR